MPQVSLAYDDDGESANALLGNHCLTRLELSRKDNSVHLTFQRSGSWQPNFKTVHIWQAGERPLTVNGSPWVGGEVGF